MREDNQCGGGPGPQIGFFAWTRYLDAWVNGTSPAIIGTSSSGRTMPLCMYPETAHYDGTGNVDDASNWTCE